MKQPSKWTNNRLDRAFKDWVNSVRDYLVDVSDRLTSTDKRLNARIDNLVAPNNKPSDDNEIRDARTDYDGKLHGSLKARLDNERKRTVDSFNETNDNLAQTNMKITEVDNKLTRLYDDKNNTKIIYVSQERGNDSTGDGTQEKPYKSIQRGVDAIPMVSSAAYFVRIEKGTYRENVLVQNINASNLTIEAYNHESAQPEKGSLAVFLRNIRIADCTGYCRIRGIEFIDHKNLPVNDLVKCHIDFARIKYGVVSKCRFAENAKNNEITSVYYNASTGRAYENHFQNQDTVIYANYLSNFNFAETNTGSNNRKALYVGRSIAYQQNTQVKADEADSSYAGGQIFK